MSSFQGHVEQRRRRAVPRVHDDRQGQGSFINDKNGRLIIHLSFIIIDSTSMFTSYFAVITLSSLNSCLLQLPSASAEPHCPVCFGVFVEVIEDGSQHRPIVINDDDTSTPAARCDCDTFVYVESNQCLAINASMNQHTHHKYSAAVAEVPDMLSPRHRHQQRTQYYGDEHTDDVEEGMCVTPLLLHLLDIYVRICRRFLRRR